MSDRWRNTLVAATVFLALAGVFGRHEVARLWAAMTLFNQDVIVENFSAMGRAFHTLDLPHGNAPPSDLPRRGSLSLPQESRDWFRAIRPL